MVIEVAALSMYSEYQIRLGSFFLLRNLHKYKRVCDQNPGVRQRQIQIGQTEGAEK